jgi:hypothetical protein
VELPGSIVHGATLTGALEAASAAAGVAEGIGVGTVITAATGSILPPDDFTSLSFARKSEGKDHAPNVDPAPKEWIQRTPEDVKNHFEKLKGSADWVRSKEDGKQVYRNIHTGEKRWPDHLHNEIECNKGNKAWIIDPVTGKILDKEGHLLK